VNANSNTTVAMESYSNPNRNHHHPQPQQSSKPCSVITRKLHSTNSNMGSTILANLSARESTRRKSKSKNKNKRTSPSVEALPPLECRPSADNERDRMGQRGRTTLTDLDRPKRRSRNKRASPSVEALPLKRRRSPGIERERVGRQSRATMREFGGGVLDTDGADESKLGSWVLDTDNPHDIEFRSRVLNTDDMASAREETNQLGQDEGGMRLDRGRAGVLENEDEDSVDGGLVLSDEAESPERSFKNNDDSLDHNFCPSEMVEMFCDLDYIDYVREGSTSVSSVRQGMSEAGRESRTVLRGDAPTFTPRAAASDFTSPPHHSPFPCFGSSIINIGQPQQLVPRSLAYEDQPPNELFSMAKQSRKQLESAELAKRDLRREARRSKVPGFFIPFAGEESSIGRRQQLNYLSSQEQLDSDMSSTSLNTRLRKLRLDLHQLASKAVETDVDPIPRPLLKRINDLGHMEMGEHMMEALSMLFHTDDRIEQLHGRLSDQNYAQLRTYVAKMRAPALSLEENERLFPKSSNHEAVGFSMENFLRVEDSDMEDNDMARSSGPANTGPTSLEYIQDVVEQGIAAVQLGGSPLINTKGPKFEKFMALPPELRERIFEEALYTGAAIKPHLCSSTDNDKIQFHDDSMPDHNGMQKPLGITRVSRRIRAESLPCFYSANTFIVSQDTATYFMRLEHLGRFHMIRHVQFDVRTRLEKYAPVTLQHMNKHLRDVEAYERVPGTPAKQKAGLLRDTQTLAWLKAHPNHIAGGLDGLYQFICLRMLTSRFTENPNAPVDASGTCQGYTTKLVLPIPSKLIFERYSHLKWFPTVCHGLGIHLHFLEGHELTFSEHKIIGITWHQQFQKKDFRQKDAEKMDVKGRILELFPEVKGAAVTGGGMWYYRRRCRRVEGIEWFRVEH
jgi:hypothetical protein